MNTQTLIEVPKSLRAIPLRDYQKYLRFLEDNSDDVETCNFEALKVFCRLNEKDAKNIKATEYAGIVNHIINLFDDKPPLTHRFSLVGTDGVEVEFGFIPNLDELTIGEFVDLDGYIGDWQEIHKAMAVLYRPVVFKKKERYLISEYKGTKEFSDLMKDMPVDIVMGALVFFYRLGTRLSKHLVDSLETQMKEGKTYLPKAISEGSGDGINQFMRSLEELQQKLTKLRSLI